MLLCRQQSELWPLKSTLALLQRPLSIINLSCKELQVTRVSSNYVSVTENYVKV